MEMCRACLSTENPVIPIDELFIKGYNLLTHLNIMTFDGLSQYTCETCAQTVKFYLDFREKCITSETTLQQVLLEKFKSEEQTASQSNTNVQIKQEVKVENPEGAIFDNFLDDGYEPMDYESMDFLMKTEEDVKPNKPRKTKKKKLTLAEKIKAVVKPTIFGCGLCKKTYEEEDTLSAHLDKHMKGKQCNLCHETFNHWPALFGHRFTHLDVKYTRCHICKTFLYSVAHTEHHYMNKHFEGEKCALTCKQCPRTYDTPRKLSKHISMMHSGKTFICDHCSKIFKTRSSLKSHMLKHSDDNSYVCDLCGFSCKRAPGLKEHTLRKHTAFKVTCDNCNRVFPDQPSCDRHNCKREEHICPICGIQFNKRRSYNAHMLTHQNVRKYKCDRCPCAYKTRAALQAHNLRHDGIRTKQCEYCPQKFFSASVLIKHRRIHTGEKPYVCKICQRGFTGNHNLKVHMKVHGEYNLIVKRNTDPDYTIPV